MRPFFLFTMPRSGGTALQRMLGGALRFWGESRDFLEKLREVAEGELRTLNGTTEYPEDTEVRGALDVILRRRAGDYGIWSSFCGRDSWEAAVAFYSWVLRSWPEGRILFLTRDEGDAYELSLEGTAPLWVPDYGSCAGNVLKRTREQRRWMQDFAEMNPSRCVLLETRDLGSYELLSARLEPLGLQVDPQAWDAADSQRPRNLKSMFGEMEQRRAAMAPEVEEIAAGAADPFLDDPEMLAELKEEWKREEHPDLPQRLRLPLPEAGEVAAGAVALHVLRYGAADWIRDCGDSLDGWAARHGLPVTVWDSPDPAYPHPKFCEVDMLRAFLAGESQWMIYVDADVFVHPSAPMLPLARGFTIAEDLPFRGGPHEHWAGWCRKHFPELATEGWGYRNAGVWACDREAAGRLLAVIAQPYHAGVMEQHHFNVWLMLAARGGMRMNVLADEWNSFASQRQAAWFHHLAGRGNKGKKLENLRALQLLPPPPESFRPAESRGPRAICYLWHSRHARWDELRHSLRSLREHFIDPPPVHIFGDRRPAWLVDGAGVTFHRAGPYEEALAAALQVADEVLLMNDDIDYLRRTSWDDLRVALTRGGNLLRRMRANLACSSRWKRGVGRATASLHHHGADHVADFSTHTPYLFERAKSLATLRRHGVWWKLPFETLYHNDHGSPRRPCGEEKTNTLPCGPEPRFLNHGAAGPDPRTQQELQARFATPAPWEKSSRPPKTVAVIISPGGRMPHADAFMRWNPELDLQILDVDRLHGAALHAAWRGADRALFQWWDDIGRSGDFDRVLFLEWDVKFSAGVDAVFPAAGDFLVPEVKTRDERWDWWAEIGRLPAGLQGHAAGIAPQAVVMISRRCLEAMTALPDYRQAIAADIFCELRLATLASAAGYPPQVVPGLSGVGIQRLDPGESPGVWHAVKE